MDNDDALDVEGGLKDAAVWIDGGMSISKGHSGGNMQVLRQSSFAEIRACNFIPEVDSLSVGTWAKNRFDW